MNKQQITIRLRLIASLASDAAKALDNDTLYFGALENYTAQIADEAARVKAQAEQLRWKGEQ